jgi:radical SAM protein with 4Fe4S-binding SPASM domain
MPSPQAIEEALQAADRISGSYPISVSVSTPILPCLNQVSAYRRVRFAFCGAQRGAFSLYGIDPEGYLKPCSHSPQRLGSLLESSFAQLVEQPALAEFASSLPEFCRDCADLAVCRGGCRSSAHLCSGAVDGEDPYLSLWKSQARKPEQPSFTTADGNLAVCS